MTPISSKLEPAIQSRDIGQRIPCFDRCQLNVKWMSNIKEGPYKPRGMSLSTYKLKYGRHLPRLLCHRRRRLRRRRHRRAYAPTSNTASHVKYGKISSWVSFSFLYGYCNDKRTDNRVRKTKLFYCIEQQQQNYEMADHTNAVT